jgi:predicted phosphodiesterase
MPTPRLTAETMRAALAALDAFGSVDAGAKALGLPVETFRSRLKAARAAHIELRDPPPVSLSFEDAWRKWMHAIGMAKDRYQRPTRRVKRKRIKVLVVPDLHAPFHEAEMFAEMLEDAKDADKAIGIGDISDSYSLSTFIKHEPMSARDEWASVNLCIQALAERFPSVELVIGNHDARLEKRLRERLTEDQVESLRFITGGLLCPVSAIAKRYPNVSIASHQTPDGETVDWFTTCGDAWLGHPEKYSRTPGAALRAVEDWIQDNEAALGMSHYRLIVVGHTHAYAQIPWRAGQMLVECGTLAKTQGYMRSPKIGGRPQRRGYLTFEQENGVTDLNSVKFRWLDIEQKQRELMERSA